jgi:hypothetical protein
MVTQKRIRVRTRRGQCLSVTVSQLLAKTKINQIIVSYGRTASPQAQQRQRSRQQSRALSPLSHYYEQNYRHGDYNDYFDTFTDCV